MSEIGYYYAESGNIELIRASGQARNYPRHMHARHWTLGVLRSGSALLTTATTTPSSTAAGISSYLPARSTACAWKPKASCSSCALTVPRRSRPPTACSVSFHPEKEI